MNDHKADAFNLETNFCLAVIGSYILGLNVINIVTLVLAFALFWKYDDPARGKKEALD
jgi:hypothetical protein